MKPDQFSVISQQLNNLQKTLDVHIKDSDEEAKENQDYRVRVVALEGQVEELRKQISKLEAKLQDRMAEVAQPIIAEAQDLKETINRKKTIIVPERKKPFWKFWQRR